MVTGRKLEQAEAHLRKAYLALGFPPTLAHAVSNDVCVRLACYTGREPVPALAGVPGHCLHATRPRLVTYLDREAMAVRGALVALQAQGTVDGASLQAYLADVGRRPTTSAELASTIHRALAAAIGGGAFVSLEVDGDTITCGEPL